MATARRAARTIAVLVLLQGVSGFVMNFVLLKPVFAEPGFLVNAAAHPLQFGLAMLVGLVAGAASVGIAITAWPVFRQYSQAMALWLIALAVVSFSVTAVESIGNFSLLSLSQAYATTGAVDGDLFQGLKGVVAAARNGAHYIGLILGGSLLFVLYGVLYRFALVPRVLAAFGLIAVMLQLVAVAMPLFGHRVVFLMLAPLGVSQLALALWLMTKGFTERAPLSCSVRQRGEGECVDHP